VQKRFGMQNFRYDTSETCFATPISIFNLEALEDCYVRSLPTKGVSINFPNTSALFTSDLAVSRLATFT
jgi:hypothetical protein